MTPLRTFARLSPDDCALLIRAAFLVAAIRFALWVLPFQYLRRLLLDARLRSPSRARLRPVKSAARLAWGVRAAAHLVPGASCLTQALALHCFLVRAGHPSTVHIGVAREPRSGFRAHAWVEHAGRPWLTAAAETARYTRLASWGRPQA